MVVQFHCFAYGWPVFPALFVEGNVLYPLYIFFSFVASYLTMCGFSGLYSILLVYVSVFISVHTVLIIIALQYRSEAGGMRPLAFFFFIYQECFGFLGSSVDPYKFLYSSSIKKNAIGIALKLRLLWVVWTS